MEKENIFEKMRKSQPKIDKALKATSLSIIEIIIVLCSIDSGDVDAHPTPL